MAKGVSILSSSQPTTTRESQTCIGHVQLRDLIICPRERGVVNYVNTQAIMEHNLNSPNSSPRTIIELQYTPNTLSSLPIPDSEDILMAAGGQEAEIHLSLHGAGRHHTKSSWKMDEHLRASINNSVHLTSMNLTKSNESSVEPKLVVSNNDCSVKFYNVPIRSCNPKFDRDVGSLKLNVPVNHSSLSPDGLTLLSVGDSSKVFLHRIDGGSRLTFTSISTLSMPPPDRSPLSFGSTNLAASFSTAFSRDGMKYAVASQEGVVAIWDVRSSHPMKVLQTDKGRLPSEGGHWTGGWLSDDPYEWTRGNSKAPGWSVRNVKFGGGGRNGIGKEVMTFTEHTTFLHVVDARTFETEEIVRVPPAPISSHVHREPPSRTSSQQNLRTRSRAISARPYQRPSRPSSRHVTISANSHLGSIRHDSSMPPYVVMALEDTFRISSRGSSDNTSNTSRVWRTRRGDPTNIRSADGENTDGSGSPSRDEEDLVVIPPLGDREVDDNLRVLLNNYHGLSRVGTMSGRRGHPGDEDGEDNDDNRMEVDEETEWDCLSSHGPSRSSSPPPSGSTAGSTVTSNLRSGLSRWRARVRASYDEEAEGDDAYGVVSPEFAGETLKHDLDIAGTCFDPSGGYIYVATTESVSEWTVRGGEKRWWSDEGTAWC